MDTKGVLKKTMCILGINNALKYFFVIFLLVILSVFTYDMQSYIIETKIIGIPEKCLDYNQDGRYNKFDENYYGAINLYLAEKRGFNLMDGKGSTISKIVECDYIPNNINIIYLEDISCTGYCRFYGWLVYKLKND